MSTQKNQGSVLPISNAIVFVLIFAVALLLFFFVFGSSSNLDEHGHAKPGNYMGMIYMGGFVVPVLFTLLISTFVFTIERALSLAKAAGGKDVDGFLKKIVQSLESNDIEEARRLCDVGQRKPLAPSNRCLQNLRWFLPRCIDIELIS